MSWDWSVFGLGVLGAAAPEIIRLYTLRTDRRRFRWSWYYVLLSVPYFLLGGVVAVVLPATTPWGALYAGITMPVLINAAVKKAQEATTPAATMRGGEAKIDFRAFTDALF